MSNLRRYPVLGRPVFLTVVCHRRAPFLKADRSKELVLDALRESRLAHPFRLHAYVVLDDHLHLLLTPASGDFTRLMHAFKVRFAHRYAVMWFGSRRRAVWQKRFWDHVIRDADDFRCHLDYVHHNPVRHGVVTVAADYRFSSMRSWIERGTYPLDWAAETPSAIHRLNSE